MNNNRTTAHALILLSIATLVAGCRHAGTPTNTTTVPATSPSSQGDVGVEDGDALEIIDEMACAFLSKKVGTTISSAAELQELIETISNESSPELTRECTDFLSLLMSRSFASTRLLIAWDGGGGLTQRVQDDTRFITAGAYCSGPAPPERVVIAIIANKPTRVRAENAAKNCGPVGSGWEDVQ